MAIDVFYQSKSDRPRLGDSAGFAWCTCQDARQARHFLQGLVNSYSLAAIMTGPQSHSLMLPLDCPAMKLFHWNWLHLSPTPSSHPPCQYVRTSGFRTLRMQISQLWNFRFCLLRSFSCPFQAFHIRFYYKRSFSWPFVSLDCECDFKQSFSWRVHKYASPPFSKLSQHWTVDFTTKGQLLVYHAGCKD